MYTIGAVGAGHMGMTILDGLVTAGKVQPSEVMVYEVIPERAEAARARGFAVATNECEAYANCKIFFLAVLPQQCEAVLEKLSASTESNPIVVSIVSGIGSSLIRRYLGEDTRVVNAVPNLPLSVGMGATVLSRTDNLPSDTFEKIVSAFGEMGYVSVVKEDLLTEIIPANGCAPGYAFYLFDAFAQAVAERGVDYSLAVRMVAASFAGAARMVLESDRTPEEWLTRVCSPGGLTVKGIDYFNEQDMKKMITGGVAESIKRGYELARK